MRQLPLLYYPTSIVILDDERSFLEHLDVVLDEEFNHVHLFEDPDIAL